MEREAVQKRLEEVQQKLQAVIYRLASETSNEEDRDKIFEEEDWEDKRVEAINLFYQEPYKSLCMTTLWTATLCCGRGKSDDSKRQEKYDTLYSSFQQKAPLNWYHMVKALHRTRYTETRVQDAVNGLRLLANTLHETSTELLIEDLIFNVKAKSIVDYVVNVNPFAAVPQRVIARAMSFNNKKRISPYWQAA